ncbi:MAG TPA: peptidase E [Thermoanaerobaculia bacterium]|nr:peptidase E [Thermoanaerobaculia bacterium]
MGGGGFSMEPENPLLDDFVLRLSRRQPPRVCFVPTASADAPTYIVKFYRAFAGRCIPTDLTLWNPPALPRQPSRTSELAAFVAEQDIIYVGGGDTANLLVLWRRHGLDTLLREAWRRGAVLAGVSAGMLCWFTGGVTDSFGGLEPLHDGIGLIDATACPHYDSEPNRRPTYHRAIASGMKTGYAADDGAALHFHGQNLVEVVSSKPQAGAYRVERVGEKVIETRLPVRYLGSF